MKGRAIQHDLLQAQTAGPKCQKHYSPNTKQEERHIESRDCHTLKPLLRSTCQKHVFNLFYIKLHVLGYDGNIFTSQKDDLACLSPSSPELIHLDAIIQLHSKSCCLCTPPHRKINLHSGHMKI